MMDDDEDDEDESSYSYSIDIDREGWKKHLNALRGHVEDEKTPITKMSKRKRFL